MQGIESIDAEGIRLPVSVGAAAVQAADGDVAVRMVNIHRRRRERIDPVVGLGFTGEFHAGADVMTDSAGVERRRQVSLVGQDLVADVFGIRQARPGPGAHIVRGWLGNV